MNLKASVKLESGRGWVSRLQTSASTTCRAWVSHRTDRREAVDRLDQHEAITESFHDR